MKFTDLAAQQRSMLTMLCTGQTFDTAQLGRGCNPRQDAQRAAQILMNMREQGLVFSSQKTAVQTYASWRASDYGKAVFAGRPEEVQASDVVAAMAEAQSAPSVFPGYTYVVYPTSTVAGHGAFQAQYADEQAAFAEAARLTDTHKREFCVAKLIGRVRPVTQPTHVIERV
jgi:hypothetical protein